MFFSSGKFSWIISLVVFSLPFSLLSWNFHFSDVGHPGQVLYLFIFCFAYFWLFIYSQGYFLIIEVFINYLTLCNPMDCILAGSSVHGILQARILKWVAISFSRGSSQPRDQTQVSCSVGRYFFTNWATRETPESLWMMPYQCEQVL